MNQQTRLSPPIDNFAPVTREIAGATTLVQGQLPKDLAGSLFRNGPNPQFPTDDPRAHWFTGDGMIHRLQIEDGQVQYRNRWVRTLKWQREHAAGQALAAGFGSGDAAGTDGGGVANTHILAHGGRLLALEEAHPPMAMNPQTLETLGPWTAGGVLGGPFTAHPKIDPENGELLFFGYGTDQAFGTGMVFGSLAADGTPTRVSQFNTPFAAMVHDFIATRHYVVFPILPLAASAERARQGGPPYAWQPELGGWLGVLRRDAGVESLRWLRADAGYVFHVMNGWEDAQGRIVADVVQYAAPPLFPHADGTPPRQEAGQLHRWTIAPGAPTDCFTSTQIDDLASEFPRIDDRFAGRANRHGWLAARQDSSGALDQLVHVDFATGARQVLALPPGDGTSEPVFAARGPKAAEGDGWLLAVVWRGGLQRSELVVLDAQAVGAGPIATFALPQRVPFGFHGSFVPA